MEIKYSHLKAIASTTMNLSAINLFDKNFKQLSMNSRIEVEELKPEPTFEKTINEIKANHSKSIISIDMNLNKHSSYSEHLNSDLMPWIILQYLGK